MSIFLRLIHVTLETPPVTCEYCAFVLLHFFYPLPSDKHWDGLLLTSSPTVPWWASSHTPPSTPVWEFFIKEMTKSQGPCICPAHVCYSEFKSYGMGHVMPVLQTRWGGFKKFTWRKWGSHDVNTSLSLLKPRLIPLALDTTQISFYLRQNDCTFMALWLLCLFYKDSILLEKLRNSVQDLRH